MIRSSLSELIRIVAVVFALAITPVSAVAQSAVDQIVQMVEGDGFRVTNVSRTLLRRFKVDATNQTARRQVVFTVDGRVLRDVTKPRKENGETPAFLSRIGIGSKNNADADTSGTGGGKNAATGGAGSASNDGASKSSGKGGSNKNAGGNKGNSSESSGPDEGSAGKGGGQDKDKGKGSKGKSDQGKDDKSDRGGKKDGKDRERDDRDDDDDDRDDDV